MIAEAGKNTVATAVSKKKLVFLLSKSISGIIAKAATAYTANAMAIMIETLVDAFEGFLEGKMIGSAAKNKGAITATMNANEVMK